MLPAGAGALFSFFARLHTGLSYTTGREKANGILDISRFFHIWTALRQGRGPLSSVGGSVGTGAGWALRGGFPPGPGRGRGGVLRTLRVVGAVSTPRGAAPRGGRLPGGVSQVGPGASAVGRWSLLDRRRLEPARWVPARSRAGERWGTAYPSGGRGFSGASGRSAPGGPPARRGSPFLPRNGEKEGRGQAPWTPGFMARSFPLARFGVVGRIVPVEGLVRCPCTCPDLERFFRVG